MDTPVEDKYPNLKYAVRTDSDIGKCIPLFRTQLGPGRDPVEYFKITLRTRILMMNPLIIAVLELLDWAHENDRPATICYGITPVDGGSLSATYIFSLRFENESDAIESRLLGLYVNDVVKS